MVLGDMQWVKCWDQFDFWDLGRILDLGGRSQIENMGWVIQDRGRSAVIIVHLWLLAQTDLSLKLSPSPPEGIIPWLLIACILQNVFRVSTSSFCLLSARTMLLGSEIWFHVPGECYLTDLSLNHHFCYSLLPSLCLFRGCPPETFLFTFISLLFFCLAPVNFVSFTFF